jgi:8-oxo-dGTP diphosphatase
MRNATLCFFIKGYPPNHILLGLKKSGFGKGKYNGFGGKVEDGETVIEAAVREVREEIGIQLQEIDLQNVGHLTFEFLAQPEWDQIVHVFFARKWKGIAQEGDEMKPVWFGVKEIPYQKMWADDIHWLPQVLAGERVKGWFQFKDDGETLKDMRVETR